MCALISNQINYKKTFVNFFNIFEGPNTYYLTPVNKFTIHDFSHELKQDSKGVFEFIYKKYLKSIIGFVKKNKGSEQDGKDVFQEGVIATIKNIEDNLVKPETSFESYLFNVCRYIWLNTLRSRKIQSSKQSDIEKLQDIESETMLNIDESIEFGIYQRNFKKLDKKCRQLLTLSFEGIPLKVIAQRLGFKNENYVKKRKHQCKEKLIKLIKDDIDYKIIMKDKEV